MSAVDEQEQRDPKYSRRGFLARGGVAAGAVAVGGAGAFARPVEAGPARSRFVATSPQTFGRMFPSLPPFAPPSKGVTSRFARSARRAARSTRRTR